MMQRPTITFSSITHHLGRRKPMRRRPFRLAAPMLLGAAAISASFAPDANSLHQRALAEMLSVYPQSTLQDIYKSAFQNVFGPEHIIANREAARRYLERELSELPADRRVDHYYDLAYPDGRFVRVDLAAIAEGYVTTDELFDAFIKGAAPATAEQFEEWRKQWDDYLSIISGETAGGLADFRADSLHIDSLLRSGQYAVHHSDLYESTYHPHYRIIRRDLFDAYILPRLPR